MPISLVTHITCHVAYVCALCPPLVALLVAFNAWCASFLLDFVFEKVSGDRWRNAFWRKGFEVIKCRLNGTKGFIFSLNPPTSYNVSCNCFTKLLKPKVVQDVAEDFQRYLKPLPIGGLVAGLSTHPMVCAIEISIWWFELLSHCFWAKSWSTRRDGWMQLFFFDFFQVCFFVENGRCGFVSFLWPGWYVRPQWLSFCCSYGWLKIIGLAKSRTKQCSKWPIVCMSTGMWKMRLNSDLFLDELWSPKIPPLILLCCFLLHFFMVKGCRRF